MHLGLFERRVIFFPVVCFIWKERVHKYPLFQKVIFSERVDYSAYIFSALTMLLFILKAYYLGGSFLIHFSRNELTKIGDKYLRASCIAYKWYNTLMGKRSNEGNVKIERRRGCKKMQKHIYHIRSHGCHITVGVFYLDWKWFIGCNLHKVEEVNLTGKF